MKDYWQNNLLNKKLNEEFPHDFGLCDIDGVVMCLNYNKKRFIIFESKNEFEKISDSQLRILKTLKESIDWTKFDDYSGIFILRIIDIDSNIKWYDLDDNLVRNTTMLEVYNIFSKKV